MNYKDFKSGSDIRGFGLGDSSNPLYLTDEAVSRICLGFANWLAKHCNKAPGELSVSIGHDSRLSAQRIKNAAIGALTSVGISIIDCSLCSTPAMFMTTVDLGCDGAVQITASHHPKDRNGLKFFAREGGLNGSAIEKILEFAENATFESVTVKGKTESVDFLSNYAERLRQMICQGVNAEEYSKPLSGIKIVVDAGNGVGGFFAFQVLEPLGADVSSSQFLEPDGSFPNHAPNPEDKAAMKSISQAVKESNADFGVIFDTDVDRAGCVGKGGYEINRNRLVALAASIALENNAGGTIVTDSVTSDGVTDFIKNCGGIHLRYKRGYRNVIDKQIELTHQGINCPLAIETSGHASFRENYFLDDGAYLITKIIIKMACLRKNGKNIDDLIATLDEPLEERELRFSIESDNFRNYGKNVIERLTDYAWRKQGWSVVPDNYEGVRISCDKDNGNGWLLLRMSVHDPVMPLNLESNEIGGTMKILYDFHHFIKDFDMLDISCLRELLI